MRGRGDNEYIQDMLGEIAKTEKFLPGHLARPNGIPSLS